ncbi:ComF family protein [Candidatus Saccharibacteria bacterium]|nr:ComF family protein [Candidatus Saccharibacteria bacterium]
MPYTRAWCAGERRDVLQRLIGLYKFERARVAHKVLGDLLLQTLPELPSETIIVPVPTAHSHVRERGYDHTVLIAQYIATKRNLKFEESLSRIGSTTQRRASATKRQSQAKTAFAARRDIINDVPYLLVDDIVTTGSTIKYAAQVLKNAGATEVWVAVLARQTLD